MVFLATWLACIEWLMHGRRMLLPSQTTPPPLACVQTSSCRTCWTHWSACTTTSRPRWCPTTCPSCSRWENAASLVQAQVQAAHAPRVPVFWVGGCCSWVGGAAQASKQSLRAVERAHTRGRRVQPGQHGTATHPPPRPAVPCRCWGTRSTAQPTRASAPAPPARPRTTGLGQQVGLATPP